MVYKLGNLSDFAPLSINNAKHKEVLTRHLSLLTNLYGADRDIDHADGGFVIYAEPGTTEQTLKACFDYSRHIPEYIIYDDVSNLCTILYLLNNEFAVTLFLASEDVPHEIKE